MCSQPFQLDLDKITGVEIADGNMTLFTDSVEYKRQLIDQLRRPSEEKASSNEDQK